MDIELFEIYNYVLTAEEIKNLYEGKRYKAPNISNTLLHLTAERGVIEDKAGNTITNTNVEVVKDGGTYVQKYDGSTSKLEINGSNPGTKDFSIYAWVKNQKTIRCTIVDNGFDSGTGYLVYLLNSGFLGWSIRYNSSIIIKTVATSISLNTWNFIAVVFTRNQNATAYVNGTELGSMDISPFNGYNISNSSDIVIGNRASTGVLNGNLSNFVIVHKSLTPQEISQLYTSTKHKYQI